MRPEGRRLQVVVLRLARARAPDDLAQLVHLRQHVVRVARLRHVLARDVLEQRHGLGERVGVGPAWGQPQRARLRERCRRIERASILLRCVRAPRRHAKKHAACVRQPTTWAPAFTLASAAARAAGPDGSCCASPAGGTVVGASRPVVVAVVFSRPTHGGALFLP